MAWLAADKADPERTSRHHIAIGAVRESTIALAGPTIRLAIRAWTQCSWTRTIAAAENDTEAMIEYVI